MERFVIERKSTGLEWEPFGFPRNDIDEAIRTLNTLRRHEKGKRYEGRLRLVRETREVIDA